MNLLIVTEIEYILGEGHGNPLQYSCLENLMDTVGDQSDLHSTTPRYVLRRR